MGASNYKPLFYSKLCVYKFKQVVQQTFRLDIKYVETMKKLDRTQVENEQKLGLTVNVKHPFGDTQLRFDLIKICKKLG